MGVLTQGDVKILKKLFDDADEDGSGGIDFEVRSRGHCQRVCEKQE